MKKVLIITYYWPPSGGGGVQRWLKFSKYLRQFGWEPIIYTAQDAEYPVLDPSLERDVVPNTTVLRQPIWEPYNIYKKIIGQKKEERVVQVFLNENKKVGLGAKFATWVRGNFFIPDARMFWIKPSVKYLAAYLKDNPVDAVVSTGPPHSMHLIAKGLKEKLGLPWLADFRDPWTAIDYHQHLMLTPIAKRIHHKLEYKVVNMADSVVVLTTKNKTEFAQLVPNGNKIEFITNGFDEDDMPTTAPINYNQFTIVHTGLLNQDRNIPIFWQALANLVKQNPSFASVLKIKLVGKADFSVKESVKQHGLEPYVEFIDYVPHKDIGAILQSATALLLPINQTPVAQGTIPGKLFEYLAAHRPIICLGPPEGDSAKIITTAQAGFAIGYTDLAGLETQLSNLITQFFNQTINPAPQGIEQYSRRNLTKKIATLLNNISAGSNANNY